MKIQRTKEEKIGEYDDVHYTFITDEYFPCNYKMIENAKQTKMEKMKIG